MLSSRLVNADSARETLFPFFEQVPAKQRVLAANWTIVAEEEGVVDGWPERSNNIDESVWKQVLRSHALTATTMRAYRNGNSKVFFDNRQRQLEDTLQAFLDQMTEFALEDTPPLEELTLDESDEDQVRDDLTEQTDAET